MKYDFHVHSTFSDSSLSFDEDINTAIQNGVDFLGMVDHDTLETTKKVNELNDKYTGISIIGGVELSCYDFKHNNIAHVIGFGCDTDNEKLKKLVNNTLDRRNNNFIKIVNTINENEPDVNIDLDELLAMHPLKSIYRPQIYNYLFEKGYDLDESKGIFKRIFNKGGYINYNIEYYDFRDAIPTIKDAGGIPILAHAFVTRNFKNINDFVDAGIMGMEARHPYHNKDEETAIIKYCKENNLLITCGSDYHGTHDNRNAGIGDCSLDDNLISPFIDVLKSLDKI